MEIVMQLLAALNSEIDSLPAGFYDTFGYTRTGNNYTHPLTIGILARILSGIESTGYVLIDPHFNDGKAKFQPDIAVVREINPLEPILYLDYESPNSSDSRIPVKDVSAYLEWTKETEEKPPYVIITTLPNRKVRKWELRYTAEDKYNHQYQGQEENIRKNPYDFWYQIYKASFDKIGLPSIHFINIDGREARTVAMGNKRSA